MSCATAKQIVELLATRHYKDVFIPECKDGPTHYSSHTRLDAWAMKRSWVNPCYFGYEVKVSRSDFIRDQKWPAYLGLCNELYFVCPAGLITIDECPENTGLIYVSKTGTRLYTKRKAVHRQIDPPVDLLLYALMRAETYTRWGVISEKLSSVRRSGDRSEEWKAWMDEKDENKELGHNVSRKIRELVRERIGRVDRESKNARRDMEKYAKLEAWLGQNGWSINSWNLQKNIGEALRGEVPANLRHRLDETQASIDRLIQEWDKHTEADTSPPVPALDLSAPAP